MRYFKFYASGLLILSFFLPWVNLSGISVSGAQLPFHIEHFLFLTANDKDSAWILFTYYVAPIEAVFFLLYTFLNRPSRFYGMLAGFLSVFGIFNILIRGGALIMASLSLGLYLYLLSGAILVVILIAERLRLPAGA